jgi:transcription termination factor Rho
MSILDRSALEESPLADLHAIASELSIDGYRRLRRPDLIDAILRRQEGAEADEEQAPAEDRDDEPSEDAGALTLPAADELTDAIAGELSAHDERAEQAVPSRRRRRGRRGGRGRGGREAEAPGAEGRGDGAGPEEPEQPALSAAEEPEQPALLAAEEENVEGVVELVPNGFAFLRVHPPEPSDEDVYISAAQVKRCELISGDRVSGPRRAPRRSERFASMIRVDTINGRPASEVAAAPRFDDLAATYPNERFQFSSQDPTVTAIEWLTPIGRGSRVIIAGPARSGKTETLRRLAEAFAQQTQVQVSLVLSGVRPEEIGGWAIEPAAAVSFAASPDAQAQTVEPVVELARRWAVRGVDAVVLIDTLDGMPPHASRKLLASARNLADGGSLTVIATAAAPLGGETTVIALDPLRASTGRFPAIDLVASGTIRPELLVGESGAEAIARARSEALG